MKATIHSHHFIRSTKFNRFGNFAPQILSPPILIIADDPNESFHLKSYLKHNYQIEIACDGQKGIKKAIELVPDIIISEVMMSAVNGYTVCATLKRNKCTSHIPIVLLKANASNSDKLTGLEHGADAYLNKPFYKEELLMHLKNLIVLKENFQKKYRKGSTFWQNLFSLYNSHSLHPEDKFLYKVNKIIQGSISDENFGIVQLSKKLAMSRAQIHRKIKALTSLSISIYIWTLRMYKAKELLRTTDLSITEIAYKVSFKDPKNFTRAFIEEFSISPSDIRKHLIVRN